MSSPAGSAPWLRCRRARTHCHRDPLRENGMVPFRAFSLTSVCPSVLTSMSSVTRLQTVVSNLQTTRCQVSGGLWISLLKTLIYSPPLPRYNISFDGLTTTRSRNGPDTAVPAVMNDAASGCAPRRWPSSSCHICSRAPENCVLDRLLALLSVTMRTLPMSKTTFSPVSLAWKSQSSKWERLLAALRSIGFGLLI